MYYYTTLQSIAYLLPQNPGQVEVLSNYFMFPVDDSPFNMGSNINLNFQN